MSILQKVLKQVDQNWDEQVNFLQRLGRYPSTLGNESGIQRYIEGTFHEMELETDSFVPDIKKMSSHPAYSPVEWSYENRPVVVGTLKNKGPKTGKSLILQGHIDVVSPEPLRLWDYDPWGSTIVGEKMYGRGINDMKSGVAAMIYAVKAIQESGVKLGADVLLQSVIEEECTGNGALALLEEGYKAEGALIPEPYGMNGLTAQVGVIWVRIRITGAGAHVEQASQAINAIDKAYVVIKALKKYEENINAQKHEDFNHLEHPLNVNVGLINSGDWASSVPSDCVLEVRVGFYPGQNPEDIKEEVKEWLFEATKQDPWLKDSPPEITFYGFHAHGVSLDSDMELFQVLRNSHDKIHDTEMGLTTSTATTDIRHYNLFYDIPATCYGPLGGNNHAPNEWVNLPSVKDCTKTYVAFILDWCGVNE